MCSLAALARSAPPPAQPCTSTPQQTPCTPPPEGKPTAAQRFPFPGEQPAPPAATPSAPAAAATPATPAPANPETASPAKRFPFPGEDPAASSSSSSTDSSLPVDPDAASSPNPDTPQAPSGRRLLKRVNPPGTKLQSPEERVAEDIDVARFYLQTGDLQGAYLRSQDAVKLAPDDPEAHCTLADSALKLSKRDQAIAEFNTCLKLDPDDKLAKSARRQLARLK